MPKQIDIEISLISSMVVDRNGVTYLAGSVFIKSLPTLVSPLATSLAKNIL